MYPGRPSIVIRLVSIILDYLFVTILFATVIVLFRKDLLADPKLLMQPKDDATRMFAWGMILVFMLKDTIGGRSLAKRMLGLHIIDNKGGYRAQAVQCFVRNIPIMVWFVEVVVLLFSPDRRLGDLMGGTRVVTDEYLHEQERLNSLTEDSGPF
ncbi:RDD family protein [Flaviaesturariibacter amylovorans]|uniref:RDD domain-containing protein n=1 Tax=Flaviaesturariibacter amylovorans TaxID=1084520 RepID=A0ABP8GSJ1_9BACT